MRWVLFLLALFPAMAGAGGGVGSAAVAGLAVLAGPAAVVEPAVGVEAAAPVEPAIVVEPAAAIGTSARLHDAAFLPAGTSLLPAGWSGGSSPPPRTYSRAPHPLANTSLPAGSSTYPRPIVPERSAALRALAARHALDRAGHRAFLLGTPPPLRSV